MNHPVSYTMPPCPSYTMRSDARFLWLDPKKYADRQETPITIKSKITDKNKFSLVNFRRIIDIPKGKNPVAHICIFADTKYS